LGAEEFGGETHLCAPAYRPDEFDALLDYCDHIVFNTPTQWRRFRSRVEAAPGRTSCGLRINPEHSEVETPIYDPCCPGSRLGTARAHLEAADLDGLDGLHFHTLCGMNVDALARTLAAVEAGFGDWLGRLRWVNFGGGHHIARADYDVDGLIRLVRDFRARHGVEVYLEPGEGVVLDAGELLATVLDVMPNGAAILDVSATCHMPDVLEMPYRPDITGAGQPGEFPWNYRLGGPTCLAGDVIGDYAFREPLAPGDRLVFEDMACYTMVKNTMFNGVRLPAIALRARDGTIRLVREFGYADYRDRLS
ncbi:MAG: carboxynorspermidine decarboxylase, partial [Candidatus Competibacterales bacterium]|nr:carboxynorspermidine decarboxylase [Candidatus Competibacterales bacterium]